MTNTDNSNQLNTNNESGDISITKNSEPKSQSFPEMVALYLLTGCRRRRNGYCYKIWV